MTLYFSRCIHNNIRRFSKHRDIILGNKNRFFSLGLHSYFLDARIRDMRDKSTCESSFVALQNNEKSVTLEKR